MNDVPSIAIIGAGALGTQIAAETLMLGSKVTIFDRNAASLGVRAGQEEIDNAIAKVLQQCEQSDLLGLASISAAPRGPSPWRLYESEVPVQATLCSSIAEAVANADVIVEAVPDSLIIKRAVFREAFIAAPAHALLCTSSLALPLQTLQEAVNWDIGGGSMGAVQARLVGLRFLWPVVFIQFVEITLTEEQTDSDCRDRLLDIIARWGKLAFVCDVQAAIGPAANENRFASESGPDFECARARFRLDDATAFYRQSLEAQIRGSLKQGSILPAATAIEQQETCCVCLQDPPQVQSVVCGHRALCTICADVLKRSNQHRCPLCRAPFRAVEERQQYFDT